jgi:predicted dehydrogenase
MEGVQVLKTVGMGFAGLGVAGKAMIEYLDTEPALRLAAVQDVNTNLAHDVGAQFGSPWVGTHFEDLLTAPGVDAVVISTPNVFHVPQTTAALRAGKDVLVQKPLATSAADARAIIELAAASGRILFVDYSYRLLETSARARDALPEIGEVRSVSAVFHNAGGPRVGRDWFFDRRLSGGGALVDLGVHMLDLVFWLVAPNSVALERAEIKVRPGFEVEHEAQLDLRLDQRPFNLAVSWGTHEQTDIRVEVIGAKGSLCWTNVDSSFAHFKTLLNERELIDREISLRENTLHAFAAALERGEAPAVDVRVYDLLDEAYQWNAGEQPV